MFLGVWPFFVPIMMEYSLAWDEIFSKESGHFACQCDNGYEGDPPLLFCRRSDEYEVFSLTQSRADLNILFT